MRGSTALARVVVDELVRCGVRHAVLCPGSRNAPLSFALHAADAAGRLRLHVRIDERTAGFLALGLALRSGLPVPVVCTSGTAAVNLHPAVVEAAHAGVPLLALSADRPAELIGTGANQTIVQGGLYGDSVRYRAALGGDQPGLWRSTVDRAVAAALGRLGPAAPGPGPGPVHVNVAFAEPLLPTPGAPWPAGRPGGAPWTVVADRGPATAGPLPLDPEARTVLVAGHGADMVDVPPGVPVIAEPPSPLWPAALRAGPWLLGSPGWAAALRPSQVVVVGRPTLHRAVQRLLADDEIDVYAVAGPGSWPDVAGTVRAVGALPALCPPADFADAWRAADTAASAALDRALDDAAAPAGLRAARSLVAALPTGALLLLGSSNPVRDVSLAALPRTGLTVLSNRGVAGIDGTVSTAVGAALAHGEAAGSGGPSFALLGDLTLLHDTTGLVIGATEPWPDLTVVVVNDDGGGIFTLLEQGVPEHAAAFERIFGTPHGVRFDALAAALGVPHTRAGDPGELRSALGPATGVRLVEVPADRSTLRAGHAAIRKAIDATAP